MEELGNKIGNFLRVTVWFYVLFCVVTLFYFMITQQEIPDGYGFFILSAHIGVMVLIVIFMLLLICT